MTCMLAFLAIILTADLADILVADLADIPVADLADMLMANSSSHQARCRIHTECN